MDLAIEYLWAAGYILPPEIKAKPAEPLPKRRGKKAARAKRQKVSR